MGSGQKDLLYYRMNWPVREPGDAAIGLERQTWTIAASLRLYLLLRLAVAAGLIAVTSIAVTSIAVTSIAAAVTADVSIAALCAAAGINLC